MATALDQVDRLTVRRLTRGFNQTSVLEAEHAIKKDSPSALVIGTEVTFTDNDLGFVFRGRIVDIKEQWSDGEGILYLCADEYRKLVKTPATINGSTVIKFSDDTTTRDMLTAILGEMPSDIFPGGYALGDLPDITVGQVNKGGQSIDNWINEALRSTDDGVCWVTYVNVGGVMQPKLMFGRLSTIGTVDFQEGNYTQIDPAVSASPLIVDGSLGETLDDKYERVRIEGCGEWERFNLRYINHSSITQPDPETPEKYVFRYDIPESFAMARYLDADGHCREDVWARIQFGNTQGVLAIGTVVIDIHNLPILFDPVIKQYYFEIIVIRTGVFSVYPPPPPVIYCYFTYTGMVSPLLGDMVTTDSRLSGEGIYIEQHPELFKFTDSGESGFSVDHTSIIWEMLSALHERYCDGPDRSGTLTAHVKGLDPEVVLGALIVDPSDLDGTSIRGITYDFIVRNMILECSNIPLRPEVFNAQRRQELHSELGGNWYLPKEDVEESCFCGGPLFTDEDGGIPPPDRGTGPSWDCIHGRCSRRSDNAGQYQTLTDCERDCTERGWNFVPCVGCIASDQIGFGQYATAQECDDDNPDPFDPQFDCNQGSSGSSGGPSGGPTSGGSGTTYECLGCGTNQVGFIKTLKVDKGGHIIQATCATCETSGWSGILTLVSSIAGSCSISGSNCSLILTVTYKTLTFSQGLLQIVS